MKAVCDTSPLILLGKISRMGLLPRLYDKVIIPSSVLAELDMKPGEEAKQVHGMLQTQKFCLHKASKKILSELPSDLGVGEREAIALAIETKVDLVILDDQQGRSVAFEKGLSTTGTIGVIIEGREQGLITSVRREMDHLIEAGMWIDEKFYHRVLQEFGE